MKVQDVVFIASVGMLFFLRRPWFFVWAGLACLALSMPLFAGWIFFTAQRLTWYAAGFFGMFILIELLEGRKVKT